MANIFKDVADETENYDEAAKNSGKAMSILSYIGFLVFIPFFAEKENPFVRFHAKQGMNLLIDGAIAMGAAWITNFIFMWIPVIRWFIIPFVNTAVYGGITALAVIGIVYAAKGKAKELPIINKLRIIK